MTKSNVTAPSVSDTDLAAISRVLRVEGFPAGTMVDVAAFPHHPDLRARTGDIEPGDVTISLRVSLADKSICLIIDSDRFNLSFELSLTLGSLVTVLWWRKRVVRLAKTDAISPDSVIAAGKNLWLPTAAAAALIGPHPVDTLGSVVRSWSDGPSTVVNRVVITPRLSNSDLPRFLDHCGVDGLDRDDDLIHLEGSPAVIKMDRT